MKKLFISQPMRGRTKEEISKERELAIKKAKALLNEDVEVLETLFDDFDSSAKPLEYLARSIEYLAQADVIYMCEDWQNARGCRIEFECAKSYGIDIIGESIDLEDEQELVEGVYEDMPNVSIKDNRIGNLTINFFRE